MKAGDVVTDADGVRWRVVELPLRLGLDPHHSQARDRAWEEVDRWNAAHAKGERDLAVKAAVDETRRGATHEWRTMLAGRENYERLRQQSADPDPGIAFATDERPNAFGNPRDRARDQLADAGVTVQQQFRSDQERIAELESRLARVPALVEALRLLAARDWDMVDWACGVASEALAEWEKP